jgi:hypothetical protein
MRNGHTQTVMICIEGVKDCWEAVCLDFDIAVQGKTLDDALASMKDAILMYLERVYELPDVERDAFLRRRAPWRVRFSFLMHAFLHGLRFRDEANGKTRAEILMPCPA